MATIPEITDRLEAATEKAENASQIIYDVANGDASTEVPTASGPTPTLKKWFQDLGSAVEPMLAGIPARLDKSVLEYETKADADSVSASLPNTQRVIARDEQIIYEVSDSSLIKISSQPTKGFVFGSASKFQDALNDSSNKQIKLEPGLYDFDGQTFTITNKNHNFRFGEYVIDLTGVEFQGSGTIIFDSCKTYLSPES